MSFALSVCVCVCVFLSKQTVALNCVNINIPFLNVINIIYGLFLLFFFLGTLIKYYNKEQMKRLLKFAECRKQNESEKLQDKKYIRMSTDNIICEFNIYFFYII